MQTPLRVLLLVCASLGPAARESAVTEQACESTTGCKDYAPPLPQPASCGSTAESAAAAAAASSIEERCADCGSEGPCSQRINFKNGGGPFVKVVYNFRQMRWCGGVVGWPEGQMYESICEACP